MTLEAAEVTERKGRLRVIVKLNLKNNLSVSVIKLMIKISHFPKMKATSMQGWNCKLTL